MMQPGLICRTLREIENYPKRQIMSYLRHWKLRTTPFRPPQSYHETFVGGSVEEAIARGEFLIAQKKKLGLIVGPSGVGKSVMVNQLAQARLFKTTNEHCCIARMLGQTPFDIVGQILRQLDPESNSETGSVEQNVLRISDTVLSWRTVGHHTILVFDETSGISDSGLDLFARLCRIPGVTTMLCVTEESLVDLPRWVVEMNELRIDLPPWDLGMVADYFDFAVSAAGGDPSIFDAQAMTRIQELADGIPRRIAQIADLALVSGAVRRSDHVNAGIVEEVCNEFTLSIGTNFPVFWESPQLNAGIPEQELT
jgi:type II secretory pathway predicted ATPase ExeA